MSREGAYGHRVDIDEGDLRRKEVHVAAGARPVEGCLDQLGEVGGDLDRRHAVGRCCHGGGGWGCVCVAGGKRESPSDAFDEVIFVGLCAMPLPLPRIGYDRGRNSEGVEGGSGGGLQSIPVAVYGGVSLDSILS